MTEETQEVEKLEGDSLLNAEAKPMDFATKPEGFPDDFWDAEKNAPSVDKLYKEWDTQKKRADGLRVKLSKGEFEGKAPEDINEYTLELSDELKPLVPEGDPLFNAAREAAKEAGLPKEAFQKFMGPIIQKLAALKGEAEQGPTEEEVNAARDAEIAKLGPTGGKIVSAVGAFIDQLKAGGTFSDSEALAAKNMIHNAESARVMNKLRMMAGGQDQIPVNMPIDDAASKSDIESKMAKAMVDGDEANYNKYSSMLAKYN